MSDETYRLIYWPSIAGRAEPIRLVLEEGGADYVDVAREAQRADPEGGGGFRLVREHYDWGHAGFPAFAPPILEIGDLRIAQSATICRFLGERLRLSPEDEAGKLHAEQFQMTLVDLMAEVHDTHHPIAVSQYYEDQKPEARRRAEMFLAARLPRHLAYASEVLERSGGEWLLGDRITYPDLGLFFVLRGLEYAFPNAFSAAVAQYPRLSRHVREVAERPRIRDYLKSDRWIGFNEDGIFRRYPELDRSPSVG